MKSIAIVAALFLTFGLASLVGCGVEESTTTTSSQFENESQTETNQTESEENEDEGNQASGKSFGEQCSSNDV
jgi:hypothetical protein